MYWMFLPPSANVGRHLVPQEVRADGFWSELWRSSWLRIGRILSAAH
jgi:hypothetical protein